MRPRSGRALSGSFMPHGRRCDETTERSCRTRAGRPPDRRPDRAPRKFLRGASYEAAKRGDIPTVDVGRLKFVPVRKMEAMLDNAGQKSTAGKTVAARAK